MASEAERLLAGSGWLPEPLRTPENDTAMLAATDTGGAEGEALPAFLAGDEEAAGSGDDDPENDAEHLIAAE